MSRKTAPSSPTAQPSRSKTVIPATSEGVEDEALPDMNEVFEQEDLRLRNLEKQKRLADFKIAHAKRMPVAKMAQNDSDDDFDIYHDAPPPNKLVDTTRRKHPDAKAILNKTNGVPAVSKQRQAMLHRAGKVARPREDVSETFVDFAGTTFGHAELRRANAGAAPAGQKKGRESMISQAQVDSMIKSKHQLQIAALQKQKEEDWGRARALPQRQKQDVEAILEMTTQAAEEAREDSEAEDTDDEDFLPEGASEDGQVLYSGDESGEDTLDDDEVDERSESAHPGHSGTDKENHPDAPAEDEEDEPEPIIHRKVRATARFAIDSDDENDATPRARAPLAEVEVPLQQTDDGLDLSGFDDGSPGFSQLFEATQAADQATASVSGCNRQV